MCFLAPKKFSAKSVKKWPRNDQKTFLGPKRVKNVVFGPPKIFSQIGQKMAEKWPTYLIQAQKGSKMWFLAPKNFSAKQVERLPKFGQKTLSRSKKGQKCGFGPEIFFQPNRSKNGQKTLSRPKNGQKCGFLPPPKIQPKWSKNG